MPSSNSTRGITWEFCRAGIRELFFFSPLRFLDAEFLPSFSTGIPGTRGSMARSRASLLAQSFIGIRKFDLVPFFSRHVPFFYKFLAQSHAAPKLLDEANTLTHLRNCPMIIYRCLILIYCKLRMARFQRSIFNFDNSCETENLHLFRKCFY